MRSSKRNKYIIYYIILMEFFNQQGSQKFDQVNYKRKAIYNELVNMIILVDLASEDGVYTT